MSRPNVMGSNVARAFVTSKKYLCDQIGLPADCVNSVAACWQQRGNLVRTMC